MSKFNWNRPAHREWRERQTHPRLPPTRLRFVALGEGDQRHWFVEGPEGLAYQRVCVLSVEQDKRWVTLGGVVWAAPGRARYAIAR